MHSTLSIVRYKCQHVNQWERLSNVVALTNFFNPWSPIPSSQQLTAEVSNFSSHLDIGMDWSKIPPDLLEMISRELSDIFDYSRFRAVCNPWRMAAKPINLSPQFPWLMLPCKPDDRARSLFNLSDKKFCTHELPEVNGKETFATSNGYLLMLDSNLNASLLNPLTGGQIQLPSLITGNESGTNFTRDEQDRVVRFWRGGYSVGCSGFNYLLRLFMGNANISSNLDSGIDFVVMISFRFYQEFILCRSGDEKWTTVETGTPRAISDITYHKGKFYIVDRAGNTAIIDVNSDTAKRFLIPPIQMHADDKCYIVQSTENIFMIVKHRRDCDIVNQSELIQVYELESGDQPKWLKVRDTCDFMFYLDKQHALCFPARNFTGCRRNCIYFLTTYRLTDGPYSGKKVCGPCIFDRKDGSIEKLPCYWDKLPDAERRAIWFAPSLW